MDDEPATLLTVAEAAQQAGVSRSTVSGWVTHGRLPAVRIAGRRYVSSADLVATRAEAYLDGVIPVWRRQRRRVGRRLRALREAAGMSQLALAVSSGVSHEVISLLERGRRAPLVATVRRLARGLAIAPERFISREPIVAPGVTTEEAAARLGVPVGRVRKWLRFGLLAGTKVSGQWRVPVEAVTELERRERLRGRSRRLDPRYRG